MLFVHIAGLFPVFYQLLPAKSSVEREKLLDARHKKPLVQMKIRFICFVTYTLNPHSLNYVYSFILSPDSYFALHGRAKLRAGTDRETRTLFVMNCRLFFFQKKKR